MLRIIGYNMDPTTQSGAVTTKPVETIDTGTPKSVVSKNANAANPLWNEFAPDYYERQLPARNHQFEVDQSFQAQSNIEILPAASQTTTVYMDSSVQPMEGNGSLSFQPEDEKRTVEEAERILKQPNTSVGTNGIDPRYAFILNGPAPSHIEYRPAYQTGRSNITPAVSSGISSLANGIIDQGLNLTPKVVDLAKGILSEVKSIGTDHLTVVSDPNQNDPKRMEEEVKRRRAEEVIKSRIGETARYDYVQARDRQKANEAISIKGSAGITNEEVKLAGGTNKAASKEALDYRYGWITIWRSRADQQKAQAEAEKNQQNPLLATGSKKQGPNLTFDANKNSEGTAVTASSSGHGMG